MKPHPLVYDRDCRFCRLCMAVVLKWDRDRRLRPVPGDDLDSWQLVLPDGTVRHAGSAFSPLFRLLPGGEPLARLTDRFPGAAERGYRWVADRRSAFGKPLPDVLRRWADGVIAERSNSESDRDSR
jgi:predicted DCC family thiol-disulfide oxidoreductase YuxK